MKKAKTIQICGTGSAVGKSVLVAGLCRIFLQEGFKVAPFKAQNMALNSAVTQDGLEIGRAQAMQAQACGLKPTVDMNPVLLKPTSNVDSQVIIYGKPIGNMSAFQYYNYKSKIFPQVKESLNRLRQEFDIVVIEGAGSPAEINLKKYDIVNMRIARLIKSPVLLVGDIDRGGIFAWLLGTLQLLSESEKKLVKGFIINKFRGNKALLKNGLRFLEKESGKKVVGVVPYYDDIKLPQEDSLFFDQPKKSRVKEDAIKIVVVRLPHISNFTDFDVFEQEEVDFEYSVDINDIKKADCIILPGSKNTCDDLEFLYEKGIVEVIKQKAEQGCVIVGICGGYQMLGNNIRDTFGVEGKKSVQGLGLLDMETQFNKEKNTYLVQAKDLTRNLLINGYEIHHGLTKINGSYLFLIIKRGDKKVHIKDGAVNYAGNVWGTYIHGLFDNHLFRHNFLNELRKKRGLPIKQVMGEFSQDKEYDKLADLLRENLEMEFIKEIIGVYNG
ncbi:MAG: cobyric acid synthase [bacterium]